MLQVAGRLTERDRHVCGLLAEHQVLTTDQIRQVFFDSTRRTTFRLDQLHQLRVLDRFRPLTPTGSAPYHWTLDTLGAAIVAVQRGIDVGDLAWRRDKPLALATSPQLGHRVGVNGFFCSLLAAARQRPDRRLVLWWSARRCAARWGHIVRPDGYGVWDDDGRRVAFLFEYDNGTERIARLAEKLDRYQRLFAATGQHVWVLFSFPGPRREAQAARVLHRPGIPVATTHLRVGESPANPAWLSVSQGASGYEPRVHLADLAQHNPSAAALNLIGVPPRAQPATRSVAFRTRRRQTFRDARRSSPLEVVTGQNGGLLNASSTST